MTVHVPVMLTEVLAQLAPQPNHWIVDGTLGGGGHTRALAELVGPEGRIVALDRDPLAVERASATLRGLPISVAQASYAELPEVLSELERPLVDGILLDLGLSSDQLAADRGFSFSDAGELDLRFDPTRGEPGWRLLERATAEQIADWIYQYGEERYSRRIARAIVERRRSSPIRTAAELAELVRRVVPRTPGPQRIDPATRTFQGLRIAVNDELGELERALQILPGCLSPGSRLAIISFHSLEDRFVKNAFRDDPRLQPLTRKPLLPSDQEVENNPRARSAKLRVAERV
jgi:16S rRNA (cytosine1402-N4)-methyltransferase